MTHESQPRGQMERHLGRFVVRHAAKLAEEMQCLEAGQLLDETVELRTVAAHLVNLCRKRQGDESRPSSRTTGVRDEREISGIRLGRPRSKIYFFFIYIHAQARFFGLGWCELI